MKTDRRSDGSRRGRSSRNVAAPVMLAVLGAATVWAQSPGTFTATGSMTTVRGEGHTATLLRDGKVLIAGGDAVRPYPALILASAELYDPATGIFTATGSMATPRSGHTATLLPNGNVLIAGGLNDHDRGSNSVTASAELYDPATGTFAATGNMVTAQSWHTATLLANGKVLIAGGITDLSTTVNAELYNPVTGTFSATGEYARTGAPVEGEERGFAILLPDGRVLIAGEYNADLAELYDPGTGTFSHSGATPNWGYIPGWWPAAYTATLLTNGKVLVAGGGDDLGRYSSAALYDAATDKFTSTGAMTAARNSHSATLLPDGTVLIAGGEFDDLPPYATRDSAELYDPFTGSFRSTGSMTARREWQTATLLNDGRVLIAGGMFYTSPGFYPGAGSIFALASAEIYTPLALMPAPVLFSVSGDGQEQGAILHANTPQLASPARPATAGDALEIYCTGLLDGSVIPPQVSIGGRFAQILFFGNAPGWPDLNQVNVRVPVGVAPVAVVPVVMNYLSRPSNGVTIAVQ